MGRQEALNMQDSPRSAICCSGTPASSCWVASEDLCRGSRTSAPGRPWDGPFPPHPCPELQAGYPVL